MNSQRMKMNNQTMKMDNQTIKQEIHMNYVTDLKMNHQKVLVPQVRKHLL